MTWLRLQENERYIKHCKSRFYRGRFYSLGYLYLTNQRLIYYKRSRVLLLILGFVPIAAAPVIFPNIYGYAFGLAFAAIVFICSYFLINWQGLFAFDIPLLDIIGVEAETKGRKKKLLVITRDDGTPYRFSVDRYDSWELNITDARSKKKAI